MRKTCKTRIIATLGDPDKNTYKNGVADFDLEELENLTIERLIFGFVFHGVCVIRLNLTHVGNSKSADKQYQAVYDKIIQVKKAILNVEAKYPWARIGLLVDLPGPKIRFNCEDWVLPTDELYIALHKVDEEFSRNPNKPQSRATVRVNVGNVSFAEAEPTAAKKILNSIRKKLDEIRGTDEKLLAFIGDNEYTLVVDRVSDDDFIVCKVSSMSGKKRLVSGSSRGFTVRGISKPISAFTEEDKQKLTAALRADYACIDDYPDERILSHVAVSFCQTEYDAMRVLYHMKEVVEAHISAAESVDLEGLLVEVPMLIAKIETEKGVNNVNSILNYADGAMIARGDLALESPMSMLGTHAKEIIKACRLRGKPCIVATQMLETMKHSIECSRAEAADVFNAVCDGVDALMLSGETSSGRYPFHAVRKMKNLATEAERFITSEEPEAKVRQEFRSRMNNFIKKRRLKEGKWSKICSRMHKLLTRKINTLRATKSKSASISLFQNQIYFVCQLLPIKEFRLKNQTSTDNVTNSVALMSANPSVEAIIAPTMSGRTARMISRFRPVHWIVALPHSTLTARKLAIIWGVVVLDVVPVVVDSRDVQALMDASLAALNTDPDLRGKQVIFTCGTPLGRVGSTNLIQHWVPTADMRPGVEFGPVESDANERSDDQHLEIERKFLVNLRLWQRPVNGGCPIRQGYLTLDKERIVRIRTTERGAYLTIKGITQGFSRSEFEIRVPQFIAERILNKLCIEPLIEKTRFEQSVGDHVWHVDVFKGENEGLVTAEIELGAEDEVFSRPQWLGAEVSDDPKYFNSNLVTEPFNSWAEEEVA